MSRDFCRGYLTACAVSVPVNLVLHALDVLGFLP